ncbi:fatty acid desaturase 2-like protein FADS2B [Gracilinanus agilis]|uniref:fatty acid desaturase 2-like protein FADS2B n=1 Tax=Gracilinanus agilis TaxID=191870 RepID=UPI001CFC7D61|nr:fatty acid desaturase 2-like protein FADS2B [Gracilinanus agilis]
MGLRMKDCEERQKANGVHEIKRYGEVNGKWESNGKAVANGQPLGKQEANGKPVAGSSSLPMYTWEEIKKHNLQTDQWLVIRRKVYDVTKWADKHPGGSRVLNHYAGEDATDVFLAMHLDQAVVQKYLKTLLIGELAPGEPSQEQNKNVQLVEDFRVLRKTVEDLNLLEPNLLFFFMHLLQILLLEALVLFILRSFGNGWLTTIFISFLLTISQVLATCNVKQSFFNDWFSGHLNFQIEHHLFPTMPRHNYYKIAPLVRSLCAKYGMDYVNKPMLKAFGDIVRSLKRSGDLWVNAYYYT